MGSGSKKKLPAMAGRIFGEAAELDVSYRSSPASIVVDGSVLSEVEVGVRVAEAFQRAAPAEARARRALVGPQRDDLEIRFAGNPAAALASAGEQRRAAFVLTMAAAELGAEAERGTTIVLMDDVESEFDDERLDRVLAFLGGAIQTLVATAKKNVAERYCSLGRVLMVEAGRIRQ